MVVAPNVLAKRNGRHYGRAATSIQRCAVPYIFTGDP